MVAVDIVFVRLILALAFMQLMRADELVGAKTRSPPGPQRRAGSVTAAAASR
jgi:hypothetical protein